MLWNRRQVRGLARLYWLAAILLLVGGCAAKNPFSEGEEGGKEMEAANIPYYANDYPDIMVPSELTWDREGSMSIKTESYTGGVMKFVGRVEVASLADFFVTSMAKSGWKLVGSAKYKNILLAFTKPNKTVMIMIAETEILRKTAVQIYITHDIISPQGHSPRSLNEDIMR